MHIAATLTHPHTDCLLHVGSRMRNAVASKLQPVSGTFYTTRTFNRHLNCEKYLKKKKKPTYFTPLTSLLGATETSVIEEALFTQGCIQQTTPVSWL